MALKKSLILATAAFAIVVSSASAQVQSTFDNNQIYEGNLYYSEPNFDPKQIPTTTPSFATWVEGRINRIENGLNTVAINADENKSEYTQDPESFAQDTITIRSKISNIRQQILTINELNKTQWQSARQSIISSLNDLDRQYEAFINQS